MTVDIHCWLAVSFGKLTRWAEGALAKALIDGGGQACLVRQRVVALDVDPGASEEALPVDAHAGHQPGTISSSAGDVRPTTRRTAVGLGQARDQGNVRVRRLAGGGPLFFSQRAIGEPPWVASTDAANVLEPEVQSSTHMRELAGGREQGADFLSEPVPKNHERDVMRMAYRRLSLVNGHRAS